MTAKEFVEANKGKKVKLRYPHSYKLKDATKWRAVVLKVSVADPKRVLVINEKIDLASR